MELIGFLWNEVIVRPMTNGLMLLYVGLFGNLGVAIIAFTLISRLVTYPLHIKQLKQTQKMTGMQPLLKEVQDKYKNDPQRRQQEVMRVYKEMGINPVGCLGPFALQIPIFIGLFYAIRNTVPFTPESLADASKLIYSWLPVLNSAAPVSRGFLWLDLAADDPYFILPILAGASMWVQQKMMAKPSTDPRQQSQQRMMQWMFPMFFVVISVSFPSGLVLYWVFSTLVGIAIQYFVTGWGGLKPQPKEVTAEVASPSIVETKLVAEEENESDGRRQIDGRGQGQRGDDREDSGGRDRNRNARTRRRPRGGRGRRR